MNSILFTNLSEPLSTTYVTTYRNYLVDYVMVFAEYTGKEMLTNSYLQAIIIEKFIKNRVKI